MDPACLVGNASYALVPANQPDTPAWVTAGDYCDAEFLFYDGFVDISEGPRIPAVSQSGEPLPPGEYLAVIDIPLRSERVVLPVTVVEAEIPVGGWRVEHAGSDGLTWLGGGNIVLSSEDRVFIADANNGSRVIAIDAASGAPIWSTTGIDLTLNTAFLQALSNDQLLVSGQHGPLRSLNVDSGREWWVFEFPADYGDLRSTLVGNTLISAAGTPRESDRRPPLVSRIDPSTGELVWQTPLTDNTDIQNGAPAIASGVVLVLSTPGEPRAGVGNTIHALDIETGQVRWTADLGGEQRFHSFPTLTTSTLAIVPGPTGIVAYDLDNGDQRWAIPGATPLALASESEVFAMNGASILRVNTRDGTFTPFAELEATAFPHPFGAVIGQQLVVSHDKGVVAYQISSAALSFSWNSPARLTDRAAVTSTHITVTTSNRSVIHVPLLDTGR